VLDIVNKTAIHLRSQQTPESGWLKDEGKKLLKHYAVMVYNNKEHLTALSVKHLVLDVPGLQMAFHRQPQVLGAGLAPGCYHPIAGWHDIALQVYRPGFNRQEKTQGVRR
jgi:hypothetical protein